MNNKVTLIEEYSSYSIIGTNIFSFIIAIFLSKMVFMYLLNWYFKIEMKTGYIYILIFTFFVFCLGVCLKNCLKFSLINTIPILLAMIFYFVSYFIYNNDLSRTPLEIFVCCIFPIFVFIQSVSYEKVLRFIIYISILCLPLVLINIINSNIDLDFGMREIGLTYPIVTFFISSFIHWKCFKKTKNKVIVFGYLENLICFCFMLPLLNRGAFLNIIVCIFLFFLFFKTHNYRQVILLNVCLIVCFVFIINFINLEFINDYLISKNLHLSFISKSVNLQLNNDFFNGRDKLLELAWNGFKESPIIGNGVCTFELKASHMSGLRYPHNLILQLLYEGGVLFFIPLAYYLIKGFLLFLFKEKNDKKIGFYIFLFSTSIPMLMISNEFWILDSFWLLLVLSMMQINFYKVNKNKSFKRGEFYDSMHYIKL